MTVSAQNQTTEGLLKNRHTNNVDYAALNWLLLVSKSSNLDKKIRTLKIENRCIVLLMSESMSGVKL